MQAYEVTAKVTMERSYYIRAAHRDEAEAAAGYLAAYEGRDPARGEDGAVREVEACEVFGWQMDSHQTIHEAREVMEAFETHNLDRYIVDPAGW